MSTPGTGGPQPPEQDPRQTGEPASWGQQPPADQPYPGQPAPTGQPYPGQQLPAGETWGTQSPAGQPWGAAQQPGTPQPFGATGAQAFSAPAVPRKSKRRWLPIVGGIVALLVVLGALTSFLGGGDPKVGDCIQQTGNSKFKTVDCESTDAQRKVIGVDADMTGDDFRKAPAEQLCADFPDTTFVLWSGSDESKKGHVYCTTDV